MPFHPSRAEVKTRPISFRMPKRWKEWLNGLREDVVSIALVGGKNTKVTQLRTGTTIDAEGGGSGGPGTLEEVTGAVNGVPAVLNVYTDGEGWAEL